MKLVNKICKKQSNIQFDNTQFTNEYCKMCILIQKCKIFNILFNNLIYNSTYIFLTNIKKFTRNWKIFVVSKMLRILFLTEFPCNNIN